MPALETIPSLDRALIADPLRAAWEFSVCAEKFGRIRGYLADVEGYALMLLARSGPGDGAIVEIGSFLGKSAAWLAFGAQQGGRGRVTAIDPFTGSPEHQPGARNEEPEIVARGSTRPRFEQNLRDAGLRESVDVIEARSTDAAARWSGPIRLLFIDGDHSEEASRADFEAWLPHTALGGLIAFHDVGVWAGVTRFYEGLTADPSSGVRGLFAVGSLRVVQRVA